MAFARVPQGRRKRKRKDLDEYTLLVHTLVALWWTESHEFLWIDRGGRACDLLASNCRISFFSVV